MVRSANRFDRRAVVVKLTGAVVTSVVMLLAGSAAAQDVRNQQALAEKKQMLNFGVLLQQAVQNGAQQMTRQIRQVTPDARLMLSGPTGVTSYRLQLGPIFDVRVPGMMPNAAWTLTQFMRQPRPNSNGGLVTPTALTPGSTASATPPPSSPFVDPALLSDPDGVYTREVKNAIVETMVENSEALHIAPEEWLTVVAKDSAQPDPAVPSSQSDFHTIIFQIKGTDLADFREGRIAVDEAKKRVTIREE
jgi:hypothetical protein